jgi:hypothetical protein
MATAEAVHSVYAAIGREYEPSPGRKRDRPQWEREAELRIELEQQRRQKERVTPRKPTEEEEEQKEEEADDETTIEPVSEQDARWHNQWNTIFPKRSDTAINFSLKDSARFLSYLRIDTDAQMLARFQREHPEQLEALRRRLQLRKIAQIDASNEAIFRSSQQVTPSLTPTAGGHEPPSREEEEASAGVQRSQEDRERILMLLRQREYCEHLFSRVGHTGRTAEHLLSSGETVTKPCYIWKSSKLVDGNRCLAVVDGKRWTNVQSLIYDYTIGEPRNPYEVFDKRAASVAQCCATTNELGAPRVCVQPAHLYLKMKPSTKKRGQKAEQEEEEKEDEPRKEQVLLSPSSSSLQSEQAIQKQVVYGEPDLWQ